MKSFTHNQINPHLLRSDKRFDAIVRKQEIEHQHLLASHNKEMQFLSDALSLAREKFESLSQQGEKELKDFKTYSVSSIDMLKEKILNQQATIDEQKKTIQSLQDQLIDLHLIYPYRSDVDKYRNELATQIKESTINHLKSLQELQREFKGLIGSFREDFSKFKEDTEKRLSEQSDRIEARFNINKIDREGVINEIRIREKELFVIEKKIENIYTLIDRINKRGESCPKPE